jgi:hypothetical protein
MLVLGLVRGNDSEPPDDEPAPRRGRTWRVPWRPLAWLLVVCVLMVLVPVAGHAFGGLVGYAVLLLAVGLGVWQIERWCDRQYWHGLREYQA